MSFIPFTNSFFFFSLVSFSQKAKNRWKKPSWCQRSPSHTMSVSIGCQSTQVADEGGSLLPHSLQLRPGVTNDVWRGVCHPKRSLSWHKPFYYYPVLCCLCYALQLYFQSKYSCALNSVIPLWTPTAKKPFGSDTPPKKAAEFRLWHGIWDFINDRQKNVPTRNTFIPQVYLRYQLRCLEIYNCWTTWTWRAIAGSAFIWPPKNVIK